MSSARQTHQFSLRVYYEDTDAEGIVYYANYLKFTERARSEFLRHIGWPPSRILNDHGVYWVVKNCNVDYRRPALLDDLLTVQTSIENLGRASMTLKQDVYRDEAVLVSMTIRLASLNEKGQITAIPKEISALMVPYLLSES